MALAARTNFQITILCIHIEFEREAAEKEGERERPKKKYFEMFEIGLCVCYSDSHLVFDFISGATVECVLLGRGREKCRDDNENTLRDILY